MNNIKYVELGSIHSTHLVKHYPLTTGSDLLIPVIVPQVLKKMREGGSISILLDFMWNHV